MAHVSAETARKVLKACTFTANDVPEWVKLDRGVYAKRRNEEISSAEWSVKVGGQGSWIRQAASMLHAAGIMSPEWGSYHHSCLIVSSMVIREHATLTAERDSALAEVERLTKRDALLSKAVTAISATRDKYLDALCKISISGSDGVSGERHARCVEIAQAATTAAAGRMAGGLTRHLLIKEDRT